MTDIRGYIPTPNMPTPSGAEGMQALGSAMAEQIKKINSAALMAQFVQMVPASGTKAEGGIPGVTNANGAPAIDGVALNFSAEDMAAALLVLQGKTQEAQLTTAKEGLTSNRKKLEEKHHEAMKKIDDWIQKCKDAEAKSKASGIFGWISKIVGVIAAAISVAVAAVATAASGGAAAPLLALAVMGMVGATMSLASQISQAAGGPPLELSSLMSKLCTSVLKACGVPEEQAEKAGKMMSGIAGLLSGAVLADPAFAGQAIAGFAELVGADANQSAIVSAVFTVVATIAIAVVAMVASGGASGADSASKMVDAGRKVADSALKTADTATKLAQAGQVVTGVVGGTSTVVQGGINIAKAHDERDAANALADKKSINAVILKLQKQMEDDREEIKKVLDQIMEGMNIVSQMINAAADSRAQLSANLSAGKANTI